MSKLQEQIKCIRKITDKAEAIERYLQEARQNYEQGYYLDCIDTINKIKILDYYHPEANAIREQAAQNISQSKPRKPKEPRCNNSFHKTKVVEAEVVTPSSYTSSYSYAENNHNAITLLDIIKWLFLAACIFAVVALLYLAVTNYIIPAVMWVGHIIAVGAEYVWMVLEQIVMLIVAVVKFVAIVVVFLFEAIFQLVEWIVMFVNWLWEALL